MGDLLYLTHRIPFPPNKGDKVRSFNLLRFLCKRYRVHLGTFVDDPADLPDDLTNTDADIGKYWLIDDLDEEGDVIGSSVYIWFGSSYRRMMMGSPVP